MELDLDIDEDDPDLDSDEDDPDDDPHCCLGYVDDPAVFLLVLDLLNHPPLEDEDDLEDDLLNHPPPLPVLKPPPPLLARTTPRTRVRQRQDLSNMSPYN